MKTFYFASHVEYGKFPLQWQVSYTEALHKGWKLNTRKWRTEHWLKNYTFQVHTIS